VKCTLRSQKFGQKWSTVACKFPIISDNRFNPRRNIDEQHKFINKITSLPYMLEKKISTITETKKKSSHLKTERERDVSPIKRSFKFVSINQR
jgi:hypothetical protein